MTYDEFVKSSWKFYLLLEKDFLLTENYLAIDFKNEESFSLEFHKQIISIQSELESVLKIYCKLLNKNSTAGNIGQYKSVILKSNGDFVTMKIKSKYLNMEFEPWKNWGDNKKLEWWEVATCIKHHTNYNGVDSLKLANQKNVLLLLSALFQVNMCMCKKISKINNLKIDIPMPNSGLFQIENWSSITSISNNAYLILKDKTLNICTI